LFGESTASVGSSGESRASRPPRGGFVVKVMQVMKNIGSEIKRRRKSANLKLNEMAERVNVTASFLSQIENGRASPSLVTLKRIAEALRTTVSVLVAEEGEAEGSPVLRKADRKTVKDNSIRMITQILTWPESWKMMEPMIFTYAGQSPRSEVRYRHAGDEFAFVLKGRLKVILDNQEYLLGPGDSIYFNSGTPHLFVNGGRGQTEVLSINTPPNF
jgi:transcriptional regulator with XRE-family HTH domain